MMFPRTNIRTEGIACTVLLGLLSFLCSCATAPQQSKIVPASKLPADAAINREAGRGGHLIVKLRLESGEEIPFLVDTGSPFTIVDKSLEEKLGKRVGKMRVWNSFGGQQRAGVFPAVPLYLGDTPLMTGDHIYSYDFKGHTTAILGLDCLSHYCIQLDFERGTMRFLNSAQTNRPDAGVAFPIAIRSGYPLVHEAGFVGESTDLLIDLGCNIDGLTARGTNRFEGIYLPESTWNNQTYSNLIVVAFSHVDALGLRFLARHLVTLDFPNHTMYLKRTDGNTLDDEGVSDPSESARKSGLKFLMNVAAKGQLPGCSANGKAPVYFEEDSAADSKSIVYKLWQNNASITHYALARTNLQAPWVLQKAWKLGSDGKIIEEYHAP
jgi:hypothetical protein